MEPTEYQPDGVTTTQRTIVKTSGSGVTLIASIIGVILFVILLAAAMLVYITYSKN
jgi:hypothetical protein